MKHSNFDYSWQFNTAGQCIRYESNYYKTTLSVPSSRKEEYIYNKDGTLSHIVNNSSERETFVTRYTYEYY
jgi:hypothetical protein